jgi:hypothetical protein
MFSIVGDLMDNESEERIRSRAHQLWQEAGEPFDREQEFWLQAEKEFNERSDQGICKDDEAQEHPSDKDRAQRSQ